MGQLPESLIGIFRQGLSEQGYVEGRNLIIDYPHADNQYDRLAALAAEFVRRQVTVIVALTSPPALAAERCGKPGRLIRHPMINGDASARAEQKRCRNWCR